MTRVFHMIGLVWLAVTSFVLTLGWNPLPGVFLGAALLAVIAASGKLPHGTYVIAGTFFISMLCLTIYQLVIIAPSLPYEGTRQTMTGTVTDLYADHNFNTLQIHTSNNLPQGLRNVNIHVIDFSALDVEIGDVINYQVELDQDPEGKRQLYSDDIRFSGRLLSVQKIAQVDSIPVRIARYRDIMSRGITRNLTGEEGTVLSAMLFGRTGQIPSDVRRDYACTGFAHLLSVSGLHLAVFVSMLSVFLELFKNSTQLCEIFKILAVLMFMALSGFSYSVIRSGIMMILWIMAQMFGRDADSRNSLGLALVLILLPNPYAVFSISLLLSYLSTLGIVMFVHPMSDWCCRHLWKINLQELQIRSAWRYNLLISICVPFCANLLTLPVVVREFGYLSLAAPVTNLLLSLLVPFAIGGGMLCGLMALIPGAELLGKAFGLAGGIAIKYINQTAKWWSKLPLAALPVTRSDFVLWSAVCTVIGVLLWRQRAAGSVKRYALCLAGITLLSGALSHRFLIKDSVLFAADEYGSSFAAAYGSQGMLIGVPDSRNAAQNLVNFFKDNGVTKLSLLVAEKDADIMKNPTALLAKEMPVETVIALDETSGFSATLFGKMKVTAQGEAAKAVKLDLGGLKIVKEFVQRPLPAHILVNQRNQLRIDSRIKLTIEDHYYGSQIFAVRLPKMPIHDIGRNCSV